MNHTTSQLSPMLYGNPIEEQHPFHLVNPSPWPLVAAIAILIFAIGAVMTMHAKAGGAVVFGAGLLMILYSMFVWWRDVVKEGLREKAHTGAVRRGLRFGMGLFILSEVMFFFAFFFAFFSASLFPAPILDDAGIWPTIQGVWPPKGIQTFDAWDLPFMNTLVLLLSGTTVTWAHYALFEKKREDLVTGLLCTVLLGLFFSVLQAVEYSHAAFKLTDGKYAAVFFLTTGFHGLHVIIGTIFLAICMIRAKKGQFTEEGHLGFEFAAWYWHFVDVVWLFVFVFVYWWGS